MIAKKFAFALVLFHGAIASGQEAIGPAVASFIFRDGNFPLEIATPNQPGTNYTQVLHVDSEQGYSDLAYDVGRGWGFEITNPEGPGAQFFGPLDKSPNNRGVFDATFEPINDIYNSFIGFENFSFLCDAFNPDLTDTTTFDKELGVPTSSVPALFGDFSSPCPVGEDAVLREQLDPPNDPRDSGAYVPEGGTFRVNVPNGFYRFVGVFGDAGNVHAHRVVVEDGGSGGPDNIGTNAVVLVDNYDQNQMIIGQNSNAPGEGVFATVGFDGHLPPMPDPNNFFPEERLPVFVPIDDSGQPILRDDGTLVDDLRTDGMAVPDSPVLEVTSGYLRLHLMQGNSNDLYETPGNPLTRVVSPRNRNGGDVVLFEIIPVDGPGMTGGTCGDFDMDGDVDAADRTVQTVGWTGAIGDGSGTATFSEGDCDGDGDVDTADLTGLIGNWTGAQAGNLIDGEDADLVYDPATGNVTIDASDTAAGQIISFVIGTDQNNMDTSATVVPFIDAGTNTDNTPFQIGQTDPLNQGAGPLVNIGNVLPTGMDLTALSDYLTIAEYASELGAGGTLDLRVVPEPSGLILAMFGLLGFALRRRK